MTTSSTFKFTWVSRTGNIDTSIRQFASFRLAGAYAAREERQDGWRCLKIEREDEAGS